MKRILPILLLLIAPHALAQQKPIRVLVGLAPGGAVEITARVFSERLRAALDVPVLVESRVGASGLIAMEAMLAAPRDGTTLLFAPNGGVTLVPQTVKAAKFDPFKDVAPVARVAHAPFVLAVNASVPVTTLAEFIAAAKQNADLRNFGASPGTIPHVLASAFGAAAGLDLVNVPYKGQGQVVIDLVGGQLLASLLTPAEALPQARTGKLRVIAQIAASRASLLPDVPTFRESGIAIDHPTWFGFYAAAGTPPAAIERIGAALAEAGRSSEVRERLAQLGLETQVMDARAVLELMRVEYADWAKAIKAAGLQAQ